MRFAETNSAISSNTSDTDTTDGLDINIKFNDDNKTFTDTDSSKDKELMRREGLHNGQILYNNRRTVNVETSEFSDLYYDNIRID